MERTLEQFKIDIVKACNEIAEFITDATFESFANDQKTYYAVMMNLIIIGESASHFPKEIRERNPDVRWTSIVGMRNFLAHEYFEIDPNKIWIAATVHVPELKKKIEELHLQ